MALWVNKNYNFGERVDLQAFWADMNYYNAPTDLEANYQSAESVQDRMHRIKSQGQSTARRQRAADRIILGAEQFDALCKTVEDHHLRKRTPRVV